MQAQEEAYDPCDTQTSVQKNTNDESMQQTTQNEPLEAQSNLDSSKSLVPPTVFVNYG